MLRCCPPPFRQKLRPGKAPPGSAKPSHAKQQSVFLQEEHHSSCPPPFPQHVCEVGTRQYYLLALTSHPFTEKDQPVFLQRTKSYIHREKSCFCISKAGGTGPEVALPLPLPDINCFLISATPCKAPPVFENGSAPCVALSVTVSRAPPAHPTHHTDPLAPFGSEMQITTLTSTKALKKWRVNVFTVVDVAKGNHYLRAKSIQVN